MKYRSFYKQGEYLPYRIETDDIDLGPVKTATVFFAVYNKQDVLANTLYSVMRQKASFELCIVDDYSDIDPTPIVKEYAPSAKFYRYPERQGFDIVMWKAIRTPGFIPDTDVLILMSADVLIPDDRTIDRMVRLVRDGMPVVATVANASYIIDKVDEGSFAGYVNVVFKQWAKYPPVIRANKDRPIYSFLMALTMNDAKKVITGEPMCDNILHFRMVDEGFAPIYPDDCIGIHQPHPASWLPCTRLDTCDLTCKLKRHFKDNT